MRIALFLLFIVGGSCSRNEEIKARDTRVSNAEFSPLITKVQAFVFTVKNGVRKLARFITGERNLPAYCAVILADSPTPEEFTRNWPMDALQEFCVDGDIACYHKNAKALAKGLECYQD